MLSNVAKELEMVAYANNGYASVTLTSGLQLHLTIQDSNRHLAIERKGESPGMAEVAECLTAFFPEGNDLTIRFNDDYCRVDIFRHEGGQV